VLAVLALLVSDVSHRLQPSDAHRNSASWALILIGLSYVCVHVATGSRGPELLKAVLLGTAFVMWGAEQFFPPSTWITLLDTAVVCVFVVDLGLSVVRSRKDKG
jgi:hypothetical protein